MKNITEPLVYIIILHWNNYSDTYECVQSLQKISYKNFKIVIVDNGSTNDSIDKLKKALKLDKILPLTKNLGFSGGNNIGIRYALKNNADYILLLNNDTVVDHNFLSKLIEISKKDQHIGIVSPKIYYAKNPHLIWATGAFENKKSKFGYIDLGFQIKDIGQFNKILEVDCVWGCCMLINKKVFKDIGLFDDEYFLYAEDIDFCYRVKQSGYKIIFQPESIIWHKVSSASGGEGNIFKDYYNTRNLLLFASKNLDINTKTRYYFFITLDSFILIIKYLIKLKFRNSVSILVGLVDGYIGTKGINQTLIK